MAVTQKPRPSAPKGKSFKKNESQESAQAGRERKREAKRKGLKPGNRQASDANSQQKKTSAQSKDPRIGSRKPVALVVDKPAVVVKAAHKPLPDPAKLAAEQEKKREADTEYGQCHDGITSLSVNIAIRCSIENRMIRTPAATHGR